MRAGLREAMGVSRSRTRVKRRKVSFGWVSWPPAAMPCSCRSRGRIGDVIAAKSQRLTQEICRVPAIRPVCPRVKERRLMARQKSEDRVLLEGGVIPAERAGSSPGSQGKAIPVEQTAGQLRLPIATAENPKGAAWRAPADRSAVSELRVTEAIVNVESVTPVTMEEVVSRVTAAFVKVVLNKGAPGPDGQTVDELLVQLPTLGPRL